MGGGGAADGRRTEGRLAPHDVVSFLKAITPSEVRVEAGRCGMNRVVRNGLGNPTSCGWKGLPVFKLIPMCP